MSVPANNREQQHAQATSATIYGKDASLLDPRDNLKMKPTSSASNVSILDKLLPSNDRSSGTSPSNVIGTSILDQLLPPDPNSEVRPSSTDGRSHAKSSRIMRNVPVLEQLQPHHTSVMSMKAAEQLEQFKLQAKLKEEKRKQLRMDEEQRRRERDGLRATGLVASEKGDTHRAENRDGMEQQREGIHDSTREQRRGSCRDHSHDSLGDRSSTGGTPGSSSSPNHNYVLTHEGAMLRRREQERRMRELAKDVDLTSQMELMANFEASF